MNIKSEIERIKWYSNLLNGIVDRYEENSQFFMDEENMESVKLMSIILNKLNEDCSVSFNMIKRNLIDKNIYTMEIDSSIYKNESDTESDMSACTIGSDNFLYNSDEENNEFNKLNLSCESENEETEEIYSDNNDFEIESLTNVENNQFYDNDNIQTNNVHNKEPKNINSAKEQYVNNLLNDKINTDNILLYKKKSKTDRLSNYLENSYSY